MFQRSPTRDSTLGRIFVGATAFGSGALELLFPSTCRLCDGQLGSAEDFCPRCLLGLRVSEDRMRSSSCHRCGRPGAGNLPISGSGNPNPDSGVVSTCSSCVGEKLAFDECVAMWSYDELVRTAVIAAKYGSRVPLADALGQRLGTLCAERLGANPPDLVTSVPTPFFRRVQRGQGGNPILAESVTRRLKRSAFSAVRLRTLLSITRSVKKQALLGEMARRANIRGAFKVSRRAVVKDRHVLVVDDVITSGATGSEIAEILKQSGARRVTVAVVARASAT